MVLKNCNPSDGTTNFPCGGFPRLQYLEREIGAADVSLRIARPSPVLRSQRHIAHYQ
jgi:hypothetical protein